MAYPLLKHMLTLMGQSLFCNFDAHSDTWDSFGPLDHGTMFYEAVKEGLIDVDHSIQVGLRTHNDRDVGMQVITSPDIHKQGVDAVAEMIASRIGDKPCYVSFDIDVLDPAFAPWYRYTCIWRSLQAYRRLN